MSVARPRRLIDLHFAFLPAARAVAHGASPYAGAYAQLRGGSEAPTSIRRRWPSRWSRSPRCPSRGRGCRVHRCSGSHRLRHRCGCWGCAIARCYALVLRGPPRCSRASSRVRSALLVAASRWPRHGAGETRRSSSVVLVALAIVTKLFCWPMVVWLYHATGGCVPPALRRGRRCGACSGAWAVIGFAGIGGYPPSAVVGDRVRGGATATRWRRCCTARRRSAARWDRGSAWWLALVLCHGVVSRRRGEARRVSGGGGGGAAGLADRLGSLLRVAGGPVRARLAAAVIRLAALAAGGWLPVQAATDVAGSFSGRRCRCMVMVLDLYRRGTCAAYGPLNESRGSEGLQSSPPRFDSDPRRRVER